MLELRNWSNDLKPVLLDINIAMSNLYILEHTNSIEFKEKYYDVFLSLRHQQNFILIVQLAKLFSESDNQKRSIKKICNRYKNESLDESIKKMLSKNKDKLTDIYRNRQDIIVSIDILLRDIEIKRHSIAKINDLRDKVYAHTDIVQNMHVIETHEFASLTVLANKIYNCLFGKLFDEYYHFQITEKHDLRNVIDFFNEKLNR